MTWFGAALSAAAASVPSCPGALRHVGGLPPGAAGGGAGRGGKGAGGPHPAISLKLLGCVAPAGPWLAARAARAGPGAARRRSWLNALIAAPGFFLVWFFGLWFFRPNTTR